MIAQDSSPSKPPLVNHVIVQSNLVGELVGNLATRVLLVGVAGTIGDLLLLVAAHAEAGLVVDSAEGLVTVVLLLLAALAGARLVVTLAGGLADGVLDEIHCDVLLSLLFQMCGSPC